MATVSKTYDVFLSYAASDKELAVDIVEALESTGLETFHDRVSLSTEDISSAIWDALAESRALIVIVSPETPPNAIGMVEIGAATAWNKPVYLVINGPSSIRLPDALKQYHAYPRNRIEEIVSKIHRDFEPLSEEDKDALAVSYAELNISADQLSQSAKYLNKLATKFRQKTQKQLPGERLLTELFRLRKKGALPHLRR